MLYAILFVFSEVKAVEKRDAVLTKEQQIERLTKPGSKYGNLNPFAVLMVGYDADENTTRKSFRKLSILTHPDKNPDQKVCFQRFNFVSGGLYWFIWAYMGITGLYGAYGLWKWVGLAKF